MESGVGGRCGRTGILKDTVALTDGSRRRPAANMECKFAINSSGFPPTTVNKLCNLMEAVCSIGTDSLSWERSPGGPVQSAELRRH